jgi:uncharacterized protein
VTELLHALYSGDDKRVDELLAANPMPNVFEAAALGRTERLGSLLDEDPSRANAFDDDGFQPLTLASFFGHVDAARLLLERGAEPNTLGRNEHVQTNALHAAASENKDESTRYALCKLLLENGADPNLTQGTNEFRAIDAARQNGDERLEQLLIEQGAKS